MKALLAFLSKNKYVITWTLCYMAMMWTILYVLFGFDMTSIHQWNRLMHAQLAGFGGFVFGILILAMVPMYIATTAVIWRNKKPLFTIPIPTWVVRAFAPPAPPAPDTEPEEKPATPAPDTDIYNIPNRIPTELHGAFIRVRNGVGRPQTSTFNTLNMASATAATTSNTTDTAADDFPIPTDFSMDDNTFSGDFSTTPSMPTVPTFSDITFDTPSTTADDEKPATESDTAITKILRDAGITFKIDNDIVLTDTMAIATHDDTDFWIADDETWFADGRSRPSPIKALLHHTASGTRTAVLYLGATNILDFDKMRTKWESNGIRIITDPSDLLN